AMAGLAPGVEAIVDCRSPVGPAAAEQGRLCRVADRDCPARTARGCAGGEWRCLPARYGTPTPARALPRVRVRPGGAGDGECVSGVRGPLSRSATTEAASGQRQQQTLCGRSQVCTAPGGDVCTATRGAGLH